MDIYDQIDIIHEISFHLPRFKQTNKNYNFRCPYCGDSKKSAIKARGGLFIYKNNYIYHCFNCSISRSFDNFLKDHYPEYRKKYLISKYKKTGSKDRKKRLNIISNEKKTYFLDLPKISDLPNGHLAKAYLNNRKINCFDKFYYTENFKNFVNSICEYDKIACDYTCPRIVIPFLDKSSNLFGFQGRRIDNVPHSKYITIMLHSTQPKLYGIDSLTNKGDVYIVEGPFDSLFLENSVAMCGSDFNIDDVSFIESPIFVFDNEPYNLQICNKMKNVIDNGHKIVIWPKHIKQKDINDMVIDNIEVNTLVKENTLQGLMARHIFSNWRQAN